MSAVAMETLIGERVHPLKTWPKYFHALAAGDKTFEARRNDRDYRVGDVLRLREWDTIDGYSGRELWYRVTYVLCDSDVLPLGDIAILGIRFSARGDDA